MNIKNSDQRSCHNTVELSMFSCYSGSKPESLQQPWRNWQDCLSSSLIISSNYSTVNLQAENPVSNIWNKHSIVMKFNLKSHLTCLMLLQDTAPCSLLPAVCLHDAALPLWHGPWQLWQVSLRYYRVILNIYFLFIEICCCFSFTYIDGCKLYNGSFHLIDMPLCRVCLDIIMKQFK